MFFSQTTEYALRAVVFLAINEGSSYASQEIARVIKVPAPYLAKVMQSLARAGIVSSQRGLGGGFCLAVAPGKLTVLAVVDAVDPIQRIKTCPLKLEAHGVKLCPLHKQMDEVLESVQKCFGSTTILQLIDGKGDGRHCQELDGFHMGEGEKTKDKAKDTQKAKAKKAKTGKKKRN